MKRKVIFLMVFLIILVTSSSAALVVQRVKASGTIYIRVDGSVDPPTAPISTLDNVTYNLTGNITSDGDGVVVERDNIVIDGAGQTLQGNGNGINLTERMNVTIKGAKIRGFASGVYLNNASFCSIYGNNITNNDAGIYLEYSSVNSISGNNITLNYNVGIGLNYSSGNSISGNNITDNNHGIWLYSSSNYNSISGNDVTANSGEGIKLENCLETNIVNNNITDNDLAGIWLSFSNSSVVYQNRITRTHYAGIMLDLSSSNTILENDVRDNRANIVFEYSINGGVALSSHNRIFHNNFINATWNAVTYFAGQPENFWDDSYSSGGNYWSDYNGTDANHDGIGDTPYIIDANNIDHYPLMGYFESFNVSTWSHPDDGFEEVDVISNFTVSNFGLYEWLTTPNQYLQAGQPFLRLVPVQGQNMTAGFCRMTLPNNILNTSYYTVLIDMTPIIVNKLATSNDTHTTLYFTFNTSAIEGIIIVPEFSSFLILPLFFIATLLAVIVCRRKHFYSTGK